MIKKDFDILTPLAKLHRISRKIANMVDFEVSPGYWVDRNDVGDLLTIKDTTTSVRYPALCLSSASKSESFMYDGLAAYESHDTKLGRITVIEEPGVRCHFGTSYFKNIPGVGDKITVIYGDPIKENNGKMNLLPATAGEYWVIGKCTAKDGGMIEITTTEPEKVTIV